MDRTTLQRLIRQIGLKPQIAAGQNFLCDRSVVDRMVATAKVSRESTVLEVGPGFGILTDAVLGAGAQVVAVELDQRLSAWLKKHYAENPRVTIIPGDVFKVRLDERLHDRAYQVVANLPYGATSLLIRNLLTLKPRPKRMTLMLQREVAERIVAKPGQMSLLSLLAQLYSRPRIVQLVPAQSFYPIPKVDSAVIDFPDIRTIPEEQATTIFRVARAGFSGRRKQLHNTLAHALHRKQEEIKEILETEGIDPSTRAQELRVEDWVRLAPQLF